MEDGHVKVSVDWGYSTEELKATTQKLDKSYRVDTLQNDWKDILKSADITEIKIHINKN